MTAGFTNRRLSDLLQYLANLAAENEELRGDLPRPEQNPDDDLEISTTLKSFLDHTVSKDLLRTYWAEHFGELPLRTRNSLPSLIAPAEFERDVEAVQFAALAPQIAIERGDDAFTLCLAGRRWTFDMRALQLVQQLASGGPQHIDQLVEHSGLEQTDARAFIFELANEGLVIASSTR